MRRLLSRKNISLITALYAALLLLLGKQLSPTAPSGNVQGVQTAPTKPASPTPEVPVANEPGTVVRVVDGDTVVVAENGREEKIRVVGINSPESVDPRKPVECFGSEASAHAKELLHGQSVILLRDPTQDNRDKYKRLLRYVFLDNGTRDFGRQMILDGYAYEYTYDLPYQHQQEYRQAQLQAQQDKKGLWADAACPIRLSPSPRARN